MSTVLIAGCGDLGTEAGLRFAAAGHRVVGWRRNPGNLPAPVDGVGIEPVAADLNKELPRIPADTGIVIITTAAGERSEAAYRAAYLDGPARLLDALERDGVVPRRLLFVSSTAVYGNDDGGWLDEASPAVPATVTARILLEAEHRLHTRFPGAVVLRLGGIYGPGRTRLIRLVRAGDAVRPTSPQYTNRIHRDDAAAALVHLGTAVATPAPVYLGVDSCPVDLGEVLGFLAAELGLPQPPAAAEAPSGAAEAPAGARGAAKRLSNRLLRSTGFEFTYPTFREGYRAVLAGHGERHR